MVCQSPGNIKYKQNKLYAVSFQTERSYHDIYYISYSRVRVASVVRVSWVRRGLAFHLGTLYTLAREITDARSTLLQLVNVLSKHTRGVLLCYIEFQGCITIWDLMRRNCAANSSGTTEQPNS